MKIFNMLEEVYAQKYQISENGLLRLSKKKKRKLCGLYEGARTLYQNGAFDTNVLNTPFLSVHIATIYYIIIFMIKHKPFRHIIVSTVMIVLLTSCAFYTLKKYDHEYDHETDETAIQRVSDWGFDLPNDTTVVNRYISKWQGWDGWFDSFYYVFKVSDSYSLDNTKVIDNASHKQKWENMKDSDSLVPENNRPNFENDMLCYIVIRWTNKSTQGVDREDKEYKNEFVERDQEHYRHEYMDGWFYAGKGYFIIQSHGPGQTYLYSSLSIDTSEEKIIPIDN